MAEGTNYLEEFWNHVKKRPGVCVICRESVKNNIIYYDLKREYIFAGDAWQRMCQYKLANGKFDCDVSYLAMLQYAIAFPYVRRKGGEIQEQPYSRGIKFELTGSKFKYRGDTMNSYATTIHEYLNIAAANSKVNWEICMLDPHQCLNSIISKDARLFIELNHTIGNFIPVPFVNKNKAFNVPRGRRKGATKDYWDLALMAIYEYYTNNSEEWLTHMLGNTENVALCKVWLDGFQSWCCFVRANYMEPFVNENYGKPKELWKGHFAHPERLPKYPEQFSEFFINASDWIRERGTLIAQVIIGELESSDIDCEWKKGSLEED